MDTKSLPQVTLLSGEGAAGADADIALTLGLKTFAPYAHRRFKTFEESLSALGADRSANRAAKDYLDPSVFDAITVHESCMAHEFYGIFCQTWRIDSHWHPYPFRYRVLFCGKWLHFIGIPNQCKSRQQAMGRARFKCLKLLNEEEHGRDEEACRVFDFPSSNSLQLARGS